MTINPDSQNNYEFNYNDNNRTSEGKYLLGSTINISAIQPGTTTRSNIDLAVPKAIYSSQEFYPASTIDKSIGLSLKWNADPTNQFKKVAVSIYYYKGISQTNSGGMPDYIEPLSYQVDDNGSLDVSTADLGVFPKQAYIGISITRVSCNNIAANDIKCISIVEAHSVPVLITDSSH